MSVGYLFVMMVNSDLFVAGLKKRLVASHKLNAASSRSHSIFTLYVDAVDPRYPDQKITSNHTTSICFMYNVV
jgi:hypothetical protein